MDRSSSDSVGDGHPVCANGEDNTSRKSALDEYLERVDVGASETESRESTKSKLCDDGSSTGENEELNVNGRDELKWSYSAENVPQTYWLSKGFDDHDNFLGRNGKMDASTKKRKGR